MHYEMPKKQNIKCINKWGKQKENKVIDKWNVKWYSEQQNELKKRLTRR